VNVGERRGHDIPFHEYGVITFRGDCSGSPRAGFGSKGNLEFCVAARGRCSDRGGNPFGVLAACDHFELPGSTTRAMRCAGRFC